MGAVNSDEEEKKRERQREMSKTTAGAYERQAKHILPKVNRNPLVCISYLGCLGQNAASWAVSSLAQRLGRRPRLLSQHGPGTQTAACWGSHHAWNPGKTEEEVEEVNDEKTGRVKKTFELQKGLKTPGVLGTRPENQ